MRYYEADRAAVAENARRVLAAAGSAEVYGVLKADGYGLGLAPMAELLSGQGIDRFALTEAADIDRLMDTGVPLREILLMRPVRDREEAERLLAKGLVTFSVGSPEEAVVLARAGLRLGRRPRAHVQVDTGLGRYGLPWDEPMAVRYLYASFPAVQITGIYSHLAGTGVRRQARRFRRLMETLEGWGIDPGTRHIGASGALVAHPELTLDAVRVGSAFLGRVPGGEALGLRPAGRCMAELTAVRTLGPGQTVGYGGLYRTGRRTRIALADMGAVHGLRGCAGRGRQSAAAGLGELLRCGASLFRRDGLTAEVKGVTVPVLGRVCAECAVLDVTDIDCRPGDWAAFSVNPLYLRDTPVVWTGGASSGSSATERVRPVA